MAVMRIDMTESPDAWGDLLAALTLLAKHPVDTTGPLHCGHDTLYVRADETAFTDEEIAQLDRWGFHADAEGGFYSFRYGSV